MQDKLHIMHILTPNFNNTDSRFYPLIIHGIRKTISIFYAIKETELDAKLKGGQVQ